jgi:hypothetical protein
MPKHWTIANRTTGQLAKRAVARHGIKASIVLLGAVLAIGTLEQTTTFLPQSTLVRRLFANGSRASARTTTLATAASTVSRGTLDAGVEHERIDYWTKRLATTMSSTFEVALGRMAKYSTMIDSKLAAKQMPHDLIYLAMIESQFNPSARSPVHAVGMWQFMSATARRFGLEVHGRVDERKDPARATDAAVAYLSSLHDRFGSWYLAAAAYNSGEGTVLRALKQVTGKSAGTDEDFFKILPFLPKETQDYVPKLIAAARIGNDPARYGITARPAIEVAADDVTAVARAAKRPSTRNQISTGRASRTGE